MKVYESIIKDRQPQPYPSLIPSHMDDDQPLRVLLGCFPRPTGKNHRFASLALQK